MQIKDRVWYITGAASGLGAATAELLHSKGGYVALLDLNLDAAKALEKKLGSERAHAAQVDVTSEEDVVSAIRGGRMWFRVGVSMREVSAWRERRSIRMESLLTSILSRKSWKST
jgi:NADP-dependent 3-hydroxy acid dehydrogenase YdfG